MGQNTAAQKIDSATLDCVVRFARGLELPVIPSKVEVELVDGAKGKQPGGLGEQALYYLLVWGEEGEQDLINAGYLVGQTAAFLHFRGISSRIVEGLPGGVRFGASCGKRCVAALALGYGENEGGFRRRRQEQAENVCICRDPRENWVEEVLELADKRYLLPSGSVRLLQKEGGLYFVPRNAAGKKAAVSELETGIAIASIMAAAEELWIDLSLVRSDGKPCLVGVRRAAAHT